MVFRRNGQLAEVLLAHPGGPFWAKKDDYAWSIPKGEFQDHENPLSAAKREFSEEIGIEAPNGEYFFLGEIKQAGGKLISAWAVEKDIGKIAASSNFFTIEWPPKSGQYQQYPEVDRADWFDLPEATKKVHPGQNKLIHVLADRLKLPIVDRSSPKPAKDKLTDSQISLL